MNFLRACGGLLITEGIPPSLRSGNARLESDSRLPEEEVEEQEHHEDEETAEDEEEQKEEEEEGGTCEMEEQSVSRQKELDEG